MHAQSKSTRRKKGNSEDAASPLNPYDFCKECIDHIESENMDEEVSTEGGEARGGRQRGEVHSHNKAERQRSSRSLNFARKTRDTETQRHRDIRDEDKRDRQRHEKETEANRKTVV